MFAVNVTFDNGTDEFFGDVIGIQRDSLTGELTLHFANGNGSVTFNRNRYLYYNVWRDKDGCTCGNCKTNGNGDHDSDDETVH